MEFPILHISCNYLTINMKRSSILILSTVFSLSLISGEAVRGQDTQNLQGWDPVKASNIIGAIDWCMTNSNASKSDRQIYQVFSQSASRILDRFIESDEITQAEASLVQDRVKNQGYYLGLELNAAECNNLKNLVVNWTPWQLVTSQDASFVVEMPSTPAREDTVSTIQNRKFDWILFETFIDSSSNPLLENPEYYLVGYTLLPQDYLASNSKDEIFDAFGKYILDEMGFPELKSSEREVTTDKVPARIISGDAYGQSTVIVMYIVDNRFYLNLMVGEQEAHFKRFFRSFEALDFSNKKAGL